MPSRIQKQKQSSTTDQTVEEVQATPDKADLTATDKLLDEIDEMLDEMLTDQTAQEFVTNFRQKSGQ